MARIGKSLTNHAGSKALALLAALALWVLVTAQQTQDDLVDGSVVEANVPVEPVWQGGESSDFFSEEFTVVPASLRVAGPADQVIALKRLATEPIDVAAIATNGAVEAAVILPDPSLRFVDNPIVRVEVEGGRR